MGSTPAQVTMGLDTQSIKEHAHKVRVLDTCYTAAGPASLALQVSYGHRHTENCHRLV